MRILSLSGLFLLSCGIVATAAGCLLWWRASLEVPDAARALTLAFAGLAAALAGFGLFAWASPASLFTPWRAALQALGRLLQEPCRQRDGCSGALLAASALVLFFHVPYPVYRMADDAFYYLRAALEFWEHGFLTLDGVTHTNGVQPLWMLITILLAIPFALGVPAWLFPHLTVWLLYALTLYVIQVIFQILRPYFESVWTAALAAFLSVASWPLIMNSGMEVTIEALFVALLLRYLQRGLYGQEPLQYLAIALLSLGTLLSRLDTGLWLLLLYAVLVPFLGVRLLFKSGTALTLLALPYFLFNLIGHGHVVPISGRVKRYWNDLSLLESSGTTSAWPWDVIDSPLLFKNAATAAGFVLRGLQHFFNQLSFGYTPPAWSAQAYEQEPESLKVAVALAIITGIALILWHARRLMRRDWSRGALGMYAAGIATWLYFGILLYYYEFVQYILFDYYGAVAITAFFAFAGIVLFSVLHVLPPRAQSVLAAVVLTMITLHGTSVGWSRRAPLAENVPKTHLHAHYLDLTNALLRESDPGARAGSWAAGVVSYYAQDRAVLNLEALMADEAMFSANRAADLAPYLVDQRVEYVLQRFHPDMLQLDVLDSRMSDTFSDLRVRPLIDFADAFECLYGTRTGVHTGYLWRVDLPLLEQRVAERTALRARVAALSSVVPAESVTRWEERRLEIWIRNTVGMSATGKALTYSGGSAGTRLYARAYASAPEYGSFRCDAGGGEEELHATGAGHWELVSLGTLSAGTWTIREALRTPEKITGQMRSVCFDEFYCVAPENEETFVEAMDAWLAWEQRGDAVNRRTVACPIEGERARQAANTPS